MKTLAFVAALLVTGCASPAGFQQLYDDYFPRGGQYLQSDYRRMFDETLFGPPPTSDYRPRTRKLYYALRGDADAFRAFLHDPDADTEGEFGESWHFECLLLLLKLGDNRFSQLLAPEDPATREAVGYALDPQIDWSVHHFPKTRSLYSYRYVPPSPPDQLLRNSQTAKDLTSQWS